MQDHNLPVALERFMPEDAAFPLVAPLQERVRQIEQYYRVKPAKAAQMVQDLDEGRRRYVRQYFRPLQYHLTINTARTGFEKAARVIANLVMEN